ncbi:MAG: PQQ-binding-like beta-propeller repeat protein [Blastocatellia bacterium]|nr:PQQ-binding-like beta-propeller repeat protein [Blastocatellia bacterium]
MQTVDARLVRRTFVRLDFLAFCLVLVFAAGRADAQWTQFRGPNGAGVGAAAEYPVEFSPAKNMAWKASVPYGQSSPVVVGTRLYGTASEGDRLITFCLDTRTGREVWRREARRERALEIYKANDPASPTPAADERGVVVFFPELGLISYDTDGKTRWIHRLGPFNNFYGMAGSPIIADGLVVLVCDQLAKAFVIALDRGTGRQRWRAERPGVPLGWSTPMIFRPDGARADLIVLGSSRLDAYDLASGAPRWWLPIASSGSMGTPLANGDTLLVSTLGSNEPWAPTFASTLSKYDKDKDGRLTSAEFRGDPDLGKHFGWIDENDDKFIVVEEWDKMRAFDVGEWGAIAVRPGNARGALEPAAVRWRFQKNIPYVPTPLLYQGIYYLVKTGGIVTSLDPATGRLLKQGRSPGALGEYNASPVAADGRIFLASAEGKITVLKAGAEWDVLAVNDIGDEISATPALSEGSVFVRTRTTLYCFRSALRKTDP